MENLEQTEQNIIEPAVSPEENKNSWMLKPKTLAIAGVVIAVVALGYVYKGVFVVATVNGSPVSRLALISKLEKTSGKQTLEQIITQKLIVQELDNKNINVTADEVNTDIKNIENQVTKQGGTLDQALAAQGMTKADLLEQVTINLRIEKLFADQIKVSDEDVAKYIKDNKLTAPKGQEAQFKDQARDQIKSSTLSKTVKDWISTLRADASINYFVKY